MNRENEQEQRDIEDFSHEELVEIVRKLAEIPCMDLTNLNGLSYDAKEVAEGVKVGSRIAGMYLALVSAGMDDESATAICVNESTGRNNLEVAQLGAVQQSINGTI